MSWQKIMSFPLARKNFCFIIFQYSHLNRSIHCVYLAEYPYLLILNHNRLYVNDYLLNDVGSVSLIDCVDERYWVICLNLCDSELCADELPLWKMWKKLFNLFILFPNQNSKKKERIFIESKSLRKRGGA